MYEEGRGRFTLKDIILQLLIVVLFVFLLIWLFPTKGYIDSKVDPLLDTMFNTNIMTMKDAAKDYYTLSRLPQNVGDKVKMTLKEMLDKKLLIAFTDKYGDECDTSASYVEVTKYDDEYVMKVYLKCSKQEDYILVHMGCYDYCSTTICEKKDEDICDSKGTPVTPVTPVEPTPTKKYICEYAFKSDGYYTPWVIGEWTTEQKTEIAGAFEKNDTKTETQTKDVQVLTGYEYKEYYDGNTPVYEYYNVVTGTNGTTTKTCTTTTEYTETTASYFYYGDETSQGTIQTNTPLTSGNGNNYTLVSANPVVCDVNCSSSVSMIYTYNMSKASTNHVTTEKEVNETGTHTQCTETTTFTPIVESVKVIKSYGTIWKQTPVYTTHHYEKKVTYYQYKSRTWVGGTSDLKWSNCNDQNLLNNGYILTGNRQEVTE